MRVRKIDRLDIYSLRLLIDIVEACLEEMSLEEERKWECSPFGVDMMHAKVRLYGLPNVSIKEAPVDWAWQIVGELGDGYLNVTQARVWKAVAKKGWWLKKRGE